MKKTSLSVAIAIAFGSAQAQRAPNEVIIYTPVDGTVSIGRRSTNTNRTVEVLVNKQDKVKQIVMEWKFVANEGQPFVIPVYPQKVRYGVTGFWIEKILEAGGTCTNAFFGGDPREGVVKRCEYWTGPPQVVIKPPPTDHGAGLPVNIDGITFQPGINYQYLSEPGPQKPVAQPGDWEKGGDLRTLCNATKMARDDPIVNPGQPGAAHMHTFFGAVNINAYTTPENIRLNNQFSSCRGGMINSTGYWVPTLFDMATGKAIVPRQNLVYYKTQLWSYMIGFPNITPLPQGLRMVTGDAKATSGTNWNTSYGCLMPALGYNRPIPTDRTDKQIPDWCAVGDQMWQVINFPQCWDGVNLDSPDHKAHMAFPVANTIPPGTPERQYKCPDTHPKVIVAISYHIQYNVPANPDEMKKWALSSDVYKNTEPDKPGGYSSHGDWMYGWDPAISNLWGANCSQVRRDCGSHEVGDGRQALEFQGN
jgi:hypothetical protein